MEVSAASIVVVRHIAFFSSLFSIPIWQQQLTREEKSFSVPIIFFYGFAFFSASDRAQRVINSEKFSRGIAQSICIPLFVFQRNNAEKMSKRWATSSVHWFSLKLHENNSRAEWLALGSFFTAKYWLSKHFSRKSCFEFRLSAPPSLQERFIRPGTWQRHANMVHWNVKY